MFKVNVPVYYTKSLKDDVKIERPKHKIGKRLLVKIAKDDFFGR
jgi:putative transposon-encoded protein